MRESQEAPYSSIPLRDAQAYSSVLQAQSRETSSQAHTKANHPRMIPTMRRCLWMDYSWPSYNSAESVKIEAKAEDDTDVDNRIGKEAAKNSQTEHDGDIKVSIEMEDIEE